MNVALLTRADWIDIGAASDIVPRSARLVTTPRGPVAVFRTDADSYYAVDNRCPHRGGPLSEGIVHGDAVTCPLHNWVIDLRSGRAKGADQGCVRTVPVKIEGGRIFLGLAGLMPAGA